MVASNDLFGAFKGRCTDAGRRSYPKPEDLKERRARCEQTAEVEVKAQEMEEVAAKV